MGEHARRRCVELGSISSTALRRTAASVPDDLYRLVLDRAITEQVITEQAGAAPDHAALARPWPPCARVRSTPADGEPSSRAASNTAGASAEPAGAPPEVMLPVHTTTAALAPPPGRNRQRPLDEVALRHISSDGPGNRRSDGVAE